MGFLPFFHLVDRFLSTPPYHSFIILPSANSHILPPNLCINHRSCDTAITGPGKLRIADSNALDLRVSDWLSQSDTLKSKDLHSPALPSMPVACGSCHVARQYSLSMSRARQASRTNLAS